MSIEGQGKPHHDGYPQGQQVGVKEMPEQLPVKAQLQGSGCVLGRTGSFSFTQCYKAEAGMLPQHCRNHQGSPNPTPGRGAPLGSWWDSREVSPELGHRPEEAGAESVI